MGVGGLGDCCIKDMYESIPNSIFKAHIWPCVLVVVYRAPSGGCPGTGAMTIFVCLSASVLPLCDPPKDVTQMVFFSLLGITI